MNTAFTHLHLFGKCFPALSEINGGGKKDHCTCFLFEFRWQSAGDVKLGRANHVGDDGNCLDYWKISTSTGYPIWLGTQLQSLERAIVSINQSCFFRLWEGWAISQLGDMFRLAKLENLSANLLLPWEKTRTYMLMTL